MKRKSVVNVVKIAVIGGGPKGAALAAKAECLNAILGSKLRITIFEKHDIGANWEGKHGYTNGEQPLCTPAERDVGFPYNSAAGLEVETMMQREFSWNAFKVAQGNYRDWVGKGRAAPSHAEFSRYLKFCVNKSSAKVVRGEVFGVSSARKLWRVKYRSSGRQDVQEGFNSVVITGHGPQAQRFPKVNDAKVFDGVNVWTRFDSLMDLARQDESGAIVLIGAGGTSAAIAGSLARKGVRNPIIILGSQASFFARVDNWFENKVFADKELWNSLSEESRRVFTDRLTRGAVWANVLEDISKSENITYRSAEVKGIAYGHGLELLVNCKLSGRNDVTPVPAVAAVDATGFDDMWFMSLLSEPLRMRLGDRKSIQENIEDDLALRIKGYGPIHMPMLSQLKSPGFVSLMALGEMATDILLPYARA
ncbi:lysine N(6)-hydroxylase/L-ornithine N(5)-oxygenase family protein [Xanthomonas prunicola]|uniref:lysine N(6)-hydroxylase/L-ornithine N(5)-oxygenase family protein n=1 Tax=Xanthomonas prunicola TaxID=2053930 RepID=UPI0021B25933|nr:lysine N(6)-hydroxylase/L-ornithine N(5)-oxygenase family protein [Xanthomonas prunicola]UXA68107.1 lysine N(6)-hydroxylase/L-ornithine N(5)-oxygenase family protein [Xanthomonas prunicola]